MYNFFFFPFDYCIYLKTKSIQQVWFNGSYASKNWFWRLQPYRMY